MTDTTTQPSLTQSAAIVAQHIQVLHQQTETELDATLSQYDDPNDLARALGVTFLPSFTDNDREKLLGLGLSARLIPKVIKTVMGLEMPNDPDYLKEATRTHRVVVRKTVERFLTDSYSYAEVPTSKATAIPGLVEGLKPTEGVYDLYTFADGSCFLKTSWTESNLPFSQAWALMVSSASELRIEVREALDGTFRQNLRQMVDPSELSSDAREQIDRLIDTMVLDLIRLLAVSTHYLVAIEHSAKAAGAILANLVEAQAPSTWKSGLTVLMDDAPVATPNELRERLGDAPRASLQEALARIRPSVGTSAHDGV